MKKLLAILLCAGLLLSCAACGTVSPAPAENVPAPEETGVQGQTDTPAPEDEAEATAQENGDEAAPATDETPEGETAPATDGPAIRELTAAGAGYTVPGVEKLPTAGSMQELALELTRRAEGENPVVSPLSLWMALAMAAAGSDGKTAEEFAALLGMERDELGLAVGCLAAVLGMRQEESSLILKAANSAWVDGSADIREDYLKELADYFNAQLFSGTLSSPEALAAMNAWVNDKTEGLIPQLFDQPLQDPALVLINTLYMKAKWADPFDPAYTHEQEFRTENGVVNAPFMGKTGYMDYLTGADFEGVSLPYRDGGLCFMALKPTAGTARDLLNALTVESLGAAWAERSQARVSLRLPKFSVDYKMEMNSALRDMGLASAFSPETADFSRMGTGGGGEPLYIGRVLQKVKVIVDEEGTEAAAATAIEMRAGSALITDPPIPLTFDEPFVYVIADSRSGAVLFSGVLDDPS